MVSENTDLLVHKISEYIDTVSNWKGLFRKVKRLEIIIIIIVIIIIIILILLLLLLLLLLLKVSLFQEDYIFIIRY